VPIERHDEISMTTAMSIQMRRYANEKTDLPCAIEENQHMNRPQCRILSIIIDMSSHVCSSFDRQRRDDLLMRTFPLIIGLAEYVSDICSQGYIRLDLL
jgi:hypothetical protein